MCITSERPLSGRAACILLISHSRLDHCGQLHWPQHFAITLQSMSSPPKMTCVFEMCLRGKAGSNCKSQLRCSFLKTLLLMWKVDVAELLFENANCSCLKPLLTDSLLLRGSMEENMLTVPFKTFWRPCRSSFKCPITSPSCVDPKNCDNKGSQAKKVRQSLLAVP